ncbi:MAG TPA: hypothetical protein PLB73_16630, partial [Leptospiraceae bacterium]|nr:hypothetical protein [Leptospiraceae bacterium]
MAIVENTSRAQGLYDPGLDKDSCGVGFVVDIQGRKTRRIVDLGLQVIHNLEHRGAVGADPKAGDGAGLMLQIPHGFFAEEAKRIGFELKQMLVWRKPHF